MYLSFVANNENYFMQAQTLKRNISQFSGYVWIDNEVFHYLPFTVFLIRIIKNETLQQQNSCKEKKYIYFYHLCFLSKQNCM